MFVVIPSVPVGVSDIELTLVSLAKSCDNWKLCVFVDRSMKREVIMELCLLTGPRSGR